MVVVAGGKHGEGKKGTKKYLPDYGWDALSADATPIPIESWKKGSSDKCDESVLRAMKANTIKSISKTTNKLINLVSALQKCDENGDEAPTTSTVREGGSSRFQDTLGKQKEHHLKTVLAPKHRTCDRVDTTFVVPYSEKAPPNSLLEIELFG